MIWTGRGLALISVFFWGASYVWGKTVMTWLPPFAASGLRFGLAAAVLLVLALRYGNPLRTLTGHWVKYLLLGFIGITCFQGVLFTALHLTSAVSASVIMALTPVLTALGAAAFLGEKLTARSFCHSAIPSNQRRSISDGLRFAQPIQHLPLAALIRPKLAGQVLEKIWACGLSQELSIANRSRAFQRWPSRSKRTRSILLN